MKKRILQFPSVRKDFSYSVNTSVYTCKLPANDFHRGSNALPAVHLTTASPPIAIINKVVCHLSGTYVGLLKMTNSCVIDAQRKQTDAVAACHARMVTNP